MNLHSIFSRCVEFVYTTVCRPPIIRKIVNALLLTTVPKKIRIGETEVSLNPRDPVLSVAVRFGVYEPFEQEVFRRYCKPGFRVLDLGANVGIYTAIAGAHVRPGGRVVAVEPDAESFCHLRETIELNSFHHVSAYNLAVGNCRKLAPLYPSLDNKADARMYDAAGNRTGVEVRMLPTDEIIHEAALDRVDLIKMDIQGYEGLAWKGMSELLGRKEPLTIFMEYWPWGLQQAGTDRKGLLASILGGGIPMQSDRRIAAKDYRHQSPV